MKDINPFTCKWLERQPIFKSQLINALPQNLEYQGKSYDGTDKHSILTMIIEITDKYNIKDDYQQIVVEELNQQNKMKYPLIINRNVVKFYHINTKMVIAFSPPIPCAEMRTMYIKDEGINTLK